MGKIVKSVACVTAEYGLILPRMASVNRCARCKKPITAFGVFRHRFVHEELGPICTKCARALVPEKVALAQEMDRRLAEPTKKLK
jgi:hypothetical protein